jgi:hypothetical protein
MGCCNGSTDGEYGKLHLTKQASFFPNEAGYIVLEVFELEIFLLVRSVPRSFSVPLSHSLFFSAPAFQPPCR